MDADDAIRSFLGNPVSPLQRGGSASLLHTHRNQLSELTGGRTEAFHQTYFSGDGSKAFICWFALNPGDEFVRDGRSIPRY